MRKIIRTWKGWTTLDNAAEYEHLLAHTIFPAVKQKGVEGLEKVSISTQVKGDEVEFFLMLQFSGMKDVIRFAGEAYHMAYIPEVAVPLLLRYDATADHYELKNELIL